MRYLGFFIFVAILISGCVRVVKEPVYIPQKCGIEMPIRPAQKLSASENVRNILIYTEVLERDLKFCIRGE